MIIIRDKLGNELKKFNTSDSVGVFFCKKMNIPIAIITGEDTDIVQNRSDKLDIDYLYMGVRDKVKVAIELCQKLNISLQDVAFIGDDINDYNLLKLVGFSSCPNNASDYIHAIINFSTKKNGGDGAFREFIEKILTINNIKIIDLIN